MERSAQELELYTIPSYSSWFSWNNIHDVERISLREFFDGSSITRSPRIYKEYRDFIISKFRENPTRKLTFTEVRKSLVGDISILLKVFTFLEKWGLINFKVAGGSSNYEGIVRPGGEEEEEEDNGRGRVKVEEGAPYGVRVVAAPNSMKPIVVPSPPPPMAVDGGGVVGGVGEAGFKWPPLASYSDVYGELTEHEKKGLACGSCKENCSAALYDYKKENNFILCRKCFESGNYKKDKPADDFELKTTASKAAVWTEAETSLLIESVVKHGDNWDLVAKNVQTKSKMDCISKLIQLPFGNMFWANRKKNGYLDGIGHLSNSRQAGIASSEKQESVKADVPSHELKDNDRKQNFGADNASLPQNGNADNATLPQDGDAEDASPPKKRVCVRPTSDVVGSLMKEVGRISAMLGTHVGAAAGEAAVTALCYDNQCSREMFDDSDHYENAKASPETTDQKRAAEAVNVAEVEKPIQSGIEEKSSMKNIVSMNLRTRAATAAALGAAAANAKVLAAQEEREMAELVATVMDTQLKKLRQKMKYFEDLEVIMEKEHAELVELEESLVADKIDVLKRVISAGINKLREQGIVKYPADAV